MTEGPALIHDGRGGIWRHLLANGAINADPWLSALAQDKLVGTCGPCGGYLRPGKPYRLGLRDWYPATCVNPQCGHEMAAAGPKPSENRKKRGAA